MTIYDGLIEMRKAGMNLTSLVFVNTISSSFLIQPIMGEDLDENVEVALICIIIDLTKSPYYLVFSPV